MASRRQRCPPGALRAASGITSTASDAARRNWTLLPAPPRSSRLAFQARPPASGEDFRRAASKLRRTHSAAQMPSVASNSLHAPHLAPGTHRGAERRAPTNPAMRRAWSSSGPCVSMKLTGGERRCFLPFVGSAAPLALFGRLHASHRQLRTQLRPEFSRCFPLAREALGFAQARPMRR